ncbi:MAG: VCBS repeat-containing protein, partial [Planctomycetaceae bacterium]|nr:VCBS repeat-containing protein [Planctomycetaceae bacterium]
MSDRIQVNAICRWTLLALLLSGWSGCDNAKDKPAPTNESSVSTLKAAKAALKSKEFAEAERLANEIGKDDKDWSASRFVAGEAATRLDRPFEAVDYYLAVKQDGSEDAYNALFYAADVYRHSGYLSPAMNLFQQVERSVPGNAAVHERLMTLYAFSGQRWRSVPHRFFLVRTGVSKLNELAELADLERPISYGDFLDKCQQVSPDDVLVKMAVAFHYRNEGFPDKAIPLLREIIAEDRSLVAAQASLGELILDSSTEEFLNWHAQLPPDADLHPDVWFVRGQWARRHDDLKTATRCYWQALQLDPSHRRATYQMGQALTALGETEAAAPFNERAQILIQMTQLADRVITSKGQDEAALQEMANLMVQTGRIWEACAWALYARQHNPNVEWPSQIFENWQPLLNEMLPLTHPDKNLAMQVDYSAFPTFEKLASRIQGNSPAATNVVNAARTIRFEEKQAGIDFVYFNGHDPETPGLRQFEQTGGGVGVLDYDVDGTPDVFLPQGSEWETGSKLPTPSGKLVDSLYRNQSGENGFVNVTPQAKISETGFGQGCSVGDFNNDGFPDLYVANVGRNALLINNGDGTFSESEFDTGDVLDDWTTSCLIMDLNSDGLP